MRRLYIVPAIIAWAVGIASAQLLAPQLNSPVNNAVNVSTAPIVQWMWVVGAGYMMVYQLQIATDTNFASQFVCDSTFRHMPHVIGITPRLANSTPYFWRVRAADTAAGSQWSPWSVVWKFTTAAPTFIVHDWSAKPAGTAHITIGIANSKLCVHNADVGSFVSIYDMVGRLLESAKVMSREQTIVLPTSIGASGKSLLVSVNSMGKTFRSVLVIP